MTCNRVFCAIEATCVFLPLETKTHIHRTFSSFFLMQSLSVFPLYYKDYVMFWKRKWVWERMAVLTRSDVTLLYMRDHAECGWMSPRVWPSLSSLLGLLQGAQRGDLLQSLPVASSSVGLFLWTLSSQLPRFFRLQPSHPPLVSPSFIIPLRFGNSA